MHATRPLYLMFKPAPAKRAELVRLCTELGIAITYSPERWHCTLLLLGETSAAKIDAVHRALGSFFTGEPFPVGFDSVDGSTLKPRRGLGSAGIFQRALARRLIATGMSLPAYKFGLHLNLDYRMSGSRRRTIQPVDWLVEEIVLVESVNGEGRHIEHGRFQLERGQMTFDFIEPAQGNPDICLRS